jgi:phosphoribosylanthranilate isomerase
MVETPPNVNMFYGMRVEADVWMWRGMTMIIQIYEIQTPDEAELMIAKSVDHIGSVILSLKHCRDPVLKTTVETIKMMGRKSCLIPLFTELEAISDALRFYRPDIVHFCDHLPPPQKDSYGMSGILKRQADIRRRFPRISVMRSIPVGIQGAGEGIPSLQWAELFEPLSDFFLTDTLLTSDDNSINPKDGSAQPVTDSGQPVTGFVGITGQTCDWGIARDLVDSSRIPVILAGGLGPNNVVEAIKKVCPAGVDSCTQTNARDSQGRSIRFKKDPQKVAEMARAARRTERELTVGLKKTEN